MERGGEKNGKKEHRFWVQGEKDVSRYPLEGLQNSVKNRTRVLST